MLEIPKFLRDNRPRYLGEYFYRGQADANYEEVSSSLFRATCNVAGVNSRENVREFGLCETRNLLGVIARVLSHDELSDEDIKKALSILQHYGYDTNFVDFSRSFDVAVMFACDKYNDGDDKRDGRIFFLRNSEENVDKYDIIHPAFPTNRVAAQQSVFADPVGDGYDGRVKCAKSIKIPKEEKKEVLEYLKKIYDRFPEDDWSEAGGNLHDYLEYVKNGSANGLSEILEAETHMESARRCHHGEDFPTSKLHGEKARALYNVAESKMCNQNGKMMPLLHLQKGKLECHVFDNLEKGMEHFNVATLGSGGMGEYAYYLMALATPENRIGKRVTYCRKALINQSSDFNRGNASMILIECCKLMYEQCASGGRARRRTLDFSNQILAIPNISDGARKVAEGLIKYCENVNGSEGAEC